MWKRNRSGTQWTYTDRAATHGGITKAQLKESRTNAEWSRAAHGCRGSPLVWWCLPSRRPARLFVIARRTSAQRSSGILRPDRKPALHWYCRQARLSLAPLPSRLAWGSSRSSISGCQSPLRPRSPGRRSRSAVVMRRTVRRRARGSSDHRFCRTGAASGSPRTLPVRRPRGGPRCPAGLCMTLQKPAGSSSTRDLSLAPDGQARPGPTPARSRSAARSARGSSRLGSLC